MADSGIERRGRPRWARHDQGPETETRIRPLVSEHGRAGMPRDQLPLMFGAILEDATPQEKALMLAHLPLPIKLLRRASA